MMEITDHGIDGRTGHLYPPDERQKLLAQVKPIGPGYARRALRSGLPVTILSWLALAAASGVVGGLAYDAVKSAVKAALRRRRGPSRTVTYRDKDGRWGSERELSDTELDEYFDLAYLYASKRLAAVRRYVQADGGRTAQADAKRLARLAAELRSVASRPYPTRDDITIDPNLCSGCGRCTEACLAVFRMEGNLAVVRQEAPVSCWVERVKECVNNCPTSAILFRDPADAQSQ
jgi:ferredoxin